MFYQETRGNECIATIIIVIIIVVQTMTVTWVTVFSVGESKGHEVECQYL
jgi:hypothetical protein